MAGAIVPLLIAAEPVLAPLIKDLFSHIGKLLRGDASATVKTVAQAITPVVQQLGTAGTIPGQMDAAGIEALVEKVLQSILSTPTPSQAQAGGPSGGPATITLRVVGGTIQLGL